MKRHLLHLVAVLFVVALRGAMTNASADVRIRLRVVENGVAMESTIYIKGARQREEFTYKRRDGKPVDFAWLTQCDLRQMVGVDHAKRFYFVHAWGRGEQTLTEALAHMGGPFPPAMPAPPRRSGGGGGRVLTETVTITDTGERREMFGYTARRIKTSTVGEVTSGAAQRRDSCEQRALREETEGWYIDLLYGVDCSPDISGWFARGIPVPFSKCRERLSDGKYRFERKLVGTARFGFPVELTIRAYGDDPQRPVVTTRETLEISSHQLDAALFELPVGYNKLLPQKRSLLGRALSLFGMR